MGKFPYVMFGKCPVCGGDGGDDPDASGADASPTDTTGNGLPLIYYRGELMCELCKKQKQADEESLLVAAKHADAEEFRQSAGFERSVT